MQQRRQGYPCANVSASALKKILIQQPVPVVALARFVTEFGDEAAHIVHGHAEGRACLGDDVFLDHDAAEVIGAEFEGYLADFLPLSHPRALYAGNVVEVNAREGLGSQVFMGAHSGCAELGVLGLEGPTDESCKSSSGLPG